ncbi:concanavalin A-like lectin/glucanase [Stipitochalara longipes BDJ]|nr:concanavalin A-like lectin/glucanase [Stipitochalara longipes BDJ]
MRVSSLLLAGAAAKSLIVHSPFSNSYREPPGLPHPAGNGSLTNGMSQTWSGAWMVAPTNQTFTSTFTQFKVLQPSMPAKADNHSTYIAAEWVGLTDDQGFASTTAGVIVQAGIVIRGVRGNFTVSAWWEWYPQDEQEIHLPITWGDTISISITMKNHTTANIVMANLSKKQDQRLTVQGKASDLRFACFIVEDSPPYPFLHFANITFDGCRANVGNKKYGFDNSSGSVDMVDFGSGKSKALGSIANSTTVKPAEATLEEGRCGHAAEHNHAQTQKDYELVVECFAPSGCGVRI